MNKKILIALIATTLIVPATSQAALKSEVVTQVPTVAILDTALDNKLPMFQGRIAYEVCILEWASCPNGKSFMEGTDSALLPYSIISKNGFEHGTEMTSILLQNNPSVKVVFVRIVGATSTGVRQITNEVTFYNALDWVYKNKDRFNIQAVAMSQSHHNLMPSIDYCPTTPITQSKIKDLVTAGIPVFLPTGNDTDYSRISWPACINESISIGASDKYNEIAPYSNYDPLKTDFFTLGNANAYLPGSQPTAIAGTSVSVQMAAAQWMTLKLAKPAITYDQLYSLLVLTSKVTKNSKISSNRLINLKAALNG